MSRKSEMKAAKKAAYEAQATALTGVDLFFKNNGNPLDARMQNALGTVCLAVYRKISTFDIKSNVKTSTTPTNNPMYPDDGMVVITMRWKPTNATADQILDGLFHNKQFGESLARVIHEEGIANLEYQGSEFYLKSKDKRDAIFNAWKQRFESAAATACVSVE